VSVGAIVLGDDVEGSFSQEQAVDSVASRI
jgi:hypothetical protein